MGTEYTLLKKSGMEIALDEMSNRFELSIDANSAEVPASLHSDEGRIGRAHTSSLDMTPEDLIKVGLEILKVATYWTDSAEFDKAVREWRGSYTSYEAIMLRSLGAVGDGETDPVTQPMHRLDD